MKLSTKSGCVFAEINGKRWFLFSTSGELKAGRDNDITDLYWSDEVGKTENVELVKRSVDSIVTACNAYDDNQQAIAAQAAEIERLRAALSEIVNNTSPSPTNHYCITVAREALQPQEAENETHA